MEWTRSDTLALAASDCAACHGLGLLMGKRGRFSPCSCVLRAIFRACYARFRYCVTRDKYVSRVSMQAREGKKNVFIWSRKDEEYVADFTLNARRSLSKADYRIFNYHYLLGADWKLCCRKLKMDRGNFFHTLYRIEATLGRRFREVRPYALHPLDEYFNSTSRLVRTNVVSMRPAPSGPGPLTPPLQQAA